MGRSSGALLQGMIDSHINLQWLLDPPLVVITITPLAPEFRRAPVLKHLSGRLSIPLHWQ